ncbi:UNVERIFIED_ORG: hypothetical protein QOE_4576 [Clostridioides difficile F501]
MALVEGATLFYRRYRSLPGVLPIRAKKFEILQNYPLPYVHLTGNIQNPRLRKARNGSLLKHQRDKQSPNGFKEF